MDVDLFKMPVEYRVVGITAGGARTVLCQNVKHHKMAATVRTQVLQRRTYWKVIIEPMKPLDLLLRDPCRLVRQVKKIPWLELHLRPKTPATLRGR